VPRLALTEQPDAAGPQELEERQTQKSPGQTKKLRHEVQQGAVPQSLDVRQRVTPPPESRSQAVPPVLSRWAESEVQADELPVSRAVQQWALPSA
jgi:hypothetical protein